MRLNFLRDPLLPQAELLAFRLAPSLCPHHEFMEAKEYAPEVIKASISREALWTLEATSPRSLRQIEASSQHQYQM
mgnify:FL=1